MRLEDFDFDLPERLIAQTPLHVRSDSRLLELDKVSGKTTDRHFNEIPDLLQPGDLLVMNNTKVSGMRLFGKKQTGAIIEVLLLHLTGKPGQFQALIRPSKRVAPNTWLELEEGLMVQVLHEVEQGVRIVEFEQRVGWDVTLESIGKAPLPPYITEHLDDRNRYQTVYASVLGSAAAPTAGLHFTEEILAKLAERGVEMAEVNLSVGLDTFRPISVENIADHVMNGETCSLSPEAKSKIENCKGRIIAVGTTTVRTLESFATGKREINTGSMNTTIFISPGYEFKIVDGMFTNFHMPRTTMLFMLSSLCGNAPLMNAYRHAVEQEYRFLSFGDSMLIW